MARSGTSSECDASATAWRRLPLSPSSSCITRAVSLPRLASSESNWPRPHTMCSQSTAMLKASSATTISALYQIVSRRRIDNGMGSIPRLDQLIAGAATSPDEGGLAAIDLASQPLDVDLDHVRARIVATVPHVLRQLLASDHRAFVAAQIFEQGVFASCELQALAVDPGLPGSGVQGDATALDAIGQH